MMLSTVLQSGSRRCLLLQNYLCFAAGLVLVSYNLSAVLIWKFLYRSGLQVLSSLSLVSSSLVNPALRKSQAQIKKATTDFKRPDEFCLPAIVSLGSMFENV